MVDAGMRQGELEDKPWSHIQYRPMNRDASVLLARDRSLRRVKGMPDTVTLRLEALIPQSLGGRTIIVEQRLTQRDAEKILAAFETQR